MTKEVERVEIDVDPAAYHRRKHDELERAIVRHNDGGPMETPTVDVTDTPPR